MNGEVEDYHQILAAAATAVSLQDSGTVSAGLSSTMLMLIAGLLAVLFVMGAGIFMRSRKQ